MPVFIWQESGAFEFLFCLFFLLPYYLLTQVKSLWERATMQFGNRLVSRCSSNPSTHHECKFIIRPCLDHEKDEAVTRVHKDVLLISAILLQVLM